MEYMFREAKNFDQNISTWEVSEVTDMGGMFFEATNFDQDISNWVTSSVTNIELRPKHLRLGHIVGN